MSTNEQEKFNTWWESKGTNSVILRAQAWSAWLARAEAEQPEPQPAEDPDEWVIQDKVPPRANIDVVFWSHWRQGEEVVAQGTWEHPQVHGFTDCFGHQLSVRCRRRDLPKVEQPEQWPKYYTGIVSGTAYIKRLSPKECVVVDTDGTETAPMRWADWDERKRTEITETEAMALLNKPQPQPQKTRVRLWMRNEPKGRPSVFACDERPYPDSHKYIEIHHDSEGFYVEGVQS